MYFVDSSTMLNSSTVAFYCDDEFIRHAGLRTASRFGAVSARWMCKNGICVDLSADKFFGVYNIGSVWCFELCCRFLFVFTCFWWPSRAQVQKGEVESEFMELCLRIGQSEAKLLRPKQETLQLQVNPSCRKPIYWESKRTDKKLTSEIERPKSPIANQDWAWK